MLKQLVALFAIITIANAVGGWTEQIVITEEVMELARWSTSQLSQHTNGIDHTIMTVKNLKTQNANGINYKFTLDIVVALEDDKYEVILSFLIKLI